MKSRIACFVLAVAALTVPILLSGCASITHGSNQDIEIMSTPAAAQIEIATTAGMVAYSGTTPATAKLQRKNEYKVTISLDGYAEEEVWISKSTDGAVWGNIICGGIIGFIIDFSSGAAYRLSPDEINVSMVTASLDGKTHETYAVFRQLNDDGELQTMVVPMTRL